MPQIHELNALGLIIQCAARGCGYRTWRHLSSLPREATVPYLEKVAVCSECSHKGANVEVVQRIWMLNPAPEDREHASQLKEYIAAHPFGPSTSTARNRT